MRVIMFLKKSLDVNMGLMADSLNFGNQRSMDNGLLGLGCAYVTRTRTVDTTVDQFTLYHVWTCAFCIYTHVPTRGHADIHFGLVSRLGIAVYHMSTCPSHKRMCDA